MRIAHLLLKSGSRPIHTYPVLGRVRVLVADDDADIRLMMSIAIGQRAEVVGEATNGLEAVERAGQLLPDVVIMDMRMPVMDGVAATRLIRTRFPDIAVVGFTAVSHVSNFMEAGCVAIWNKGESQRLIDLLGR